MDKDAFVFDTLNERERRRYAELFETIGKQAQEMSVALRDKRDFDMMLIFLQFTNGIDNVKDFVNTLSEVMREKNKKEAEFPEFIQDNKGPIL